MSRQSFLIATVVLTACAAHAENWPGFRGPNGQGRSGETDVPVTWSETENIAWRAAVPGESWSSPIVWGDRVFLTTAVDEGRSCRVLSYDLNTGRPLWNVEVFRQTLKRKEDRNTFATPTPVTDGRLVYTCFGDGSFAALDFDGRIAWINRDFPFYSQHGLGTSAILHDGLLIMARDGSNDGDDRSLGWQVPWDRSYLIALDAATGTVRWKATRGMSRISHATPCIWMRDDGAQLVSEAGDVLQGFDAATGERLWSTAVIGESNVPSMVMSDTMLFTAGGWGGNETIKGFRLGDPEQMNGAEPAWEQSRGMPNIPSMLVVGEHLYAVTDNGIASCLNAATGTIVWQQRLGGTYTASPVEAAGRIYFVSDAGVTTVVEAGPRYRVLAINELGDCYVQASPAFSRGRIIIRTDGELVCIGGR